MGTYLCFTLSNSVTQEEWEKVYEKTLYLADKLGLADWGKFYYKGIRHYCFQKVKEQTREEFGKTEHYWVAFGDYKYMTSGETFGLTRELPENQYDKNAGPAILNRRHYFSKSYINSEQKPIHNETKTCGGRFHILLMAIFCYMESILKDKIFIYGDVDSYQFENAIKFANDYLDEPIDVPARCDYKRLYEIVNTLEIPAEEKLNVMEKAYLGTINLNYKKFIQEHFDNKIVEQFWRNRFKDLKISEYDFKDTLKSYFTYGFSFKDLLTYISFEEKDDYSKFLELVLEAGRYKDSFGKFGIIRNPENDKVRGFDQEFIFSLFGADSEIKISNYTFENLVTEFEKYLGDKTDVRAILKDKIKDEEEDSFFSRVKEKLANDRKFYEDEEKYDIFSSYGLIYFEKGNTLSPWLLKSINEALVQIEEYLKSNELKELEKKESTEQIYELIDMRPHFPVRDIDWHHAIDYFHSHSDAIRRYYPIFHLKGDYFSPEPQIAKALFINDEFYEFCKELKNHL